VKTKKAESGRIKLPRGTTANERAKAKVKGPSQERTLGPLESLQVKDHCQMCGANQDLEPAFNPAGKPMTLCYACRIGSAESLAQHYPQNLSDCELSTVLAALREWQRKLGPDNLPAQANAHADFADFFNGWDGTVTPLSKEEIDLLCERLNFLESDDYTPTNYFNSKTGNVIRTL